MSKSRISSNIIYLYFLTIAKILFPLLTFPYLTRVLSVDVYGMVSYVRATIIYMQIFVDFGFSLSAVKDIARIKNDKTRVGEITGDVIIAKLLLCAIGMLILLVLCVSISILQNNLLYTFLSYVVVILSVFLLDYLFRGIEEMQLVSLTFIIMKGASTLLTFVFVKGDADILWIPVLDIISSFFALFFVYVQLKKLHIKIIFRNIIYAWRSLKESFIYFISNMATTAFGGLNTMLIGIYIPDVKEIAYWSVAMTLVSGAQALYNPITGGVYPQMVKNPSMRIIRRLLLVFMPCVILGCLFTWVFAGDIVRIVNGPNYDEAAEVLRYLVPVLFFSFPGMLIGWPALGAIDKASDVTKTTVLSCIFQLAGLSLLILCNQFTLLMISIARDMTEAVLLGTRVGYLVKYRKYFVN